MPLHLELVENDFLNVQSRHILPFISGGKWFLRDFVEFPRWDCLDGSFICFFRAKMKDIKTLLLEQTNYHWQQHPVFHRSRQGSELESRYSSLSWKNACLFAVVDPANEPPQGQRRRSAARPHWFLISVCCSATPTNLARLHFGAIMSRRGWAGQTHSATQEASCHVAALLQLRQCCAGAFAPSHKMIGLQLVFCWFM